MTKSKLKVKNVTIGSDPEVFLVDNNNNPFPACGMFGGTKDNPIKIGNKGHAIQEDNVLVEFCIPPCKTAKQFVKELNVMKDYAERILHNKYNNEFKLSFKSSYVFDEKHLQTSQAKIFGCEPSYNVWTKSINEINKDNPNCRSGGFHIHIGYDKPTLEVCEELVKAFDLFVVLHSILIDDDTTRRNIYGQAGSFRMKEYGCEVRALGTFLWGTDELMNWVFNQTMKSIDFVNSGMQINDENGKRIVDCINNSKTEEAKIICEEMNIKIDIINKKETIPKKICVE